MRDPGNEVGIIPSKLTFAWQLAEESHASAWQEQIVIPKLHFALALSDYSTIKVYRYGSACERSRYTYIKGLKFHALFSELPYGTTIIDLRPYSCCYM